MTTVRPPSVYLLSAWLRPLSKTRRNHRNKKLGIVIMIFQDNFAWNCNLIYIAIKLTSEFFYILVFNGKEMIFFFLVKVQTLFVYPPISACFGCVNRDRMAIWTILMLCWVRASDIFRFLNAKKKMEHRMSYDCLFKIYLILVSPWIT